MTCYIVAEIGINHNGSLETALELVAAAKAARCDAVKFQKRTPELCVPPEQQGVMRETPWGRMTYLEYKQRIEFAFEDYCAIDAYCKQIGMDWFASCWDEPSLDLIGSFDPPYYKIASACLTDDYLLERTRIKCKPVMLSTGMSTLEEIDHAVDVLGKRDLTLLHCMSAYPAHNTELNLRCIQTLKKRYGVPVGYSGHELGIASTVAAVALGAVVVERHITLDHEMWGSDHAASLEPDELRDLVRDIRFVESALGDGVKRVYEREIPVREKLRRVWTP